MNKKIIGLVKSYWGLLIILIGMSGCNWHTANDPNIIENKKSPLSSAQEEDIDEKELREIVVFCGNPGSGKSSLLNSIFQKNVLRSGITDGGGLTQHMQEHVYEGVKYIDTPGLSDPDFQYRAAKEIEKTLSKNGKFKIFFVITVQSGRFISNDLLTINKVCEAIKIPFEYGLILNKLTPKVRSLIEEKEDTFLFTAFATLHKRPKSLLPISYDTSMDDRDNFYLTADAQDRTNLIKFISDFPATVIMHDQVAKIDVTNYAEESKELDEIIISLRKQIQLRNEQKGLELLGGTVGLTVGGAIGAAVVGPILPFIAVPVIAATTIFGGAAGKIVGPTLGPVMQKNHYGKKVMNTMGNIAGNILEEYSKIVEIMPNTYRGVSSQSQLEQGSRLEITSYPPLPDNTNGQLEYKSDDK